SAVFLFGAVASGFSEDSTLLVWSRSHYPLHEPCQRRKPISRRGYDPVSHADVSLMIDDADRKVTFA
ncbi:MAG: hypothetical protein VX728_03470, partial [Actinomycetota bacterium]|nr:hypothetical protein [Actinomycetota bacterium]